MSQPARHYQPWTDAELQRLQELTNLRVPVAQIADELGRSRTVVYQQRSVHKMVMPPAVCEFCDKPLEHAGVGRIRRFCDATCWWRSVELGRALARPAASCALCGGDMSNTHGRKYCSRYCSSRAWHEASDRFTGVSRPTGPR